MAKFNFRAIEELTKTHVSVNGATGAPFDRPVTVHRLEMHLANCINMSREQDGLSRLTFDRKLAAIARGHSAEMCGLGYFEHESPTPGLETPFDRYMAASVDEPRLIAENIYMAGSMQAPLRLALADGAHKGLMESPGHRANILLKEVTTLGVGVVANPDGNIWVTELFLWP